MLVTVFTPTHDPRDLERLAASLRRQSFQEFEWLVVPNGGVGPDQITVSLPQLRVAPYDGATQRIGEIKRFCGARARGRILVEVDHDDELTPDALDEVVKAFSAPSRPDFVYSNCCEIQNGKPWTYSAAYGWEYRPFAWNGAALQECVAFDPSPASFSKIWFAPNHLRAWWKPFYDAIGGHDAALKVLDDQDLLCRTYLRGTVRKIDRCLYIYHVHPGNTCRGELNGFIQDETLRMHDRYIYPLVERWCDLAGLRKIDLCGGIDPAPGYESVDLHGGRIAANLDDRWPFPEGEIGVFRAHDALEHLRSPLHAMKEIHRCLAPNGWLLSSTPSTDGRGAFQDPTHVSFWNSNSFWYYTRAAQARYIGTPVRFQLNRIKNHYPTAWHQTHRILYVQADLLKFHGRVPGELGFERETRAEPPRAAPRREAVSTGPGHDAPWRTPPESAAAAMVPPRPRRRPFVTLVTTTRETPLLERCCRSVDRQSYDRWQHLVIHERSTWDRSTAPLFDPRRAFLASPAENAASDDPAGAARRSAWDRILGDYILCLDETDALAHEMALELLVRALDDADWAFCPILRDGRHWMSGDGETPPAALASVVFRSSLQGERIPAPMADLTPFWQRLHRAGPPRRLTEIGPILVCGTAGRTPLPSEDRRVPPMADASFDCEHPPVRH